MVHCDQDGRRLGVLVPMRNLLLALFALLVVAGCGSGGGGGVIEPEKKGAASSPMDHAPKPPATTP